MAYTTIDKPTDYFNTITYTGDGSSSRSITGVGFQPDWVWTKKRNGATGHRLVDSVRGVTKALFTNGSNVETTESNGLTAFASDGYTLGDNTNYNANSDTYVAWNWLASNTTASNTDGSITSTVSANTTAGFSIVSYTGTGSNATVGHGLGAIPKMIILKERNPATTRSWRVYHEDVGNNKVLYLDLTNAQTSDTTAFNSTSPTSSVFSLGTSAGTNSSKNYIAYCFADVKGYLKVGTYTGNGNADGTFIYTGFKPAFVMVKNSGAAENWIIFDNKRPGYNLTDALLKPNLSNAESTSGVKFDMLSNGFKARVSDAEGNSSGGSFIYMAFAEQPFVTSTGIPACAR